MFNVLINMHVTVENWDAFPCELNAHCFYCYNSNETCNSLKKIRQQFMKFYSGFSMTYCNDQMHFTYGDQHLYDNDMIHERPSHTTLSYRK